MRYIIFPMQPTPNGRMHIGHGGGTYLRADIVARALRRDGHDVIVASGTDAFENWILAASEMDGISPEDTCKLYHDGIGEDFRSIDINFDIWVDPLSSKYHDAYVALHEDLFSNVSNEARNAVKVEESIPYGRYSELPMIGTFISGRCPACGKDVGGSSCTECNSHFQPEEIVDARSRLTDEPIRWLKEENWFLEAIDDKAILDYLQKQSIGDQHYDTVARFLSRGKGRVRLTGPGSWGIHSKMLSDDHVLSNSYYLYCLFLGRLATASKGMGPFSPGSSWNTVGVFGADNTVPGLVVPSLYSQGLPSYLKPFDSVIINGMLDLDGRKISTSKRYGIWIKDLVHLDLLTSSEIRYALSGIDMDSGRANMKLGDFVKDVNLLRELVEMLDSLSHSYAQNGMVDSAILSRQVEFLTPGNVNIVAARKILDWHGLQLKNRHSTDLGTWLALAEPFVPELVRNFRSIGSAGDSVRRGMLDQDSINRVLNV